MKLFETQKRKFDDLSGPKLNEKCNWFLPLFAAIMEYSVSVCVCLLSQSVKISSAAADHLTAKATDVNFGFFIFGSLGACTQVCCDGPPNGWPLQKEG